MPASSTHHISWQNRNTQSQDPDESTDIPGSGTSTNNLSLHRVTDYKISEKREEVSFKVMGGSNSQKSAVH